MARVLIAFILLDGQNVQGMIYLVADQCPEDHTLMNVTADFVMARTIC